MILRRGLLLFAGLAACACHAQPRQRAYDLRHVAYRLWFDEDARTFDAQVTNTIAPLQDATKSVWFDCQNLQVKGVTVDGADAKFTVADNRLSVDLGKPFDAGKSIDVAVRYSGKPTGGLYFVNKRDAWPATHSMVYSKGEPEYNRQWLVTYDFPDDKASSECWIACKPGQTAVSNGVLVGVDKKDDVWTYHWKMDQPHSTYLNAFIVGNFEKKTEMLGSLPIEYYYPEGLESQGSASFGGTARIVDYYGKLTGIAYPYDRFSQVTASDFVTGGMEDVTMVMQTINTLHEPEEEPLADSSGLVAHELAHQWFGDDVTCTNWSHMWLNEGFASLLPLFWTRESKGEGEFELARKRTMLSALRASTGDPKPVVLLDYGTDPDRMFRQSSYSGGAARMLMLMDLISEQTFWSGVKDFLTQYRFRPVDTSQFFTSMFGTSGVNLDWFEQQWFYSSGVIEIKATVDGRTLKLEEDGHARVDLPIWQFANGRWNQTLLTFTGGSLELPLPSDGPVLIDPEKRVLAKITETPAFPKEQAVAAWRASESAAVRDELLGALKSLGDSSAVVGLIDEEKVPTLRLRLTDLLGKGDEAALVALVDDHDRAVADAAVKKLATCEATPDVLAKLKSVMKSDTNPRIRCDALESLYRLTKDASLVERAWKTDAPNECFRLFALRQFVQSDKDRARKVCLDLVEHSQNLTLRLEAISQLGGLKDAEGSREVFNTLVSIVRDEFSYRGRMAAASALASYGDTAALEFLKPLTTEGNTRFGNNVAGSVRRLEKAAGSG
ncbi:MAG TPA: M1 family metallopeptidase [Fimbriimonadaceae bacterium]|nr:M1 family metallopeptidase [Fimbriimonadaceae bacterium]